MSNIEQTVQARLFELQDPQYRDFQCKLMPTVDPDTVIGVRTPELRKLAKVFGKEPEAAEFLKYITPFGYCDGADIVTNGGLDGTMIAIGAAIGVGGIVAAYLKYARKDIH